MTETSQNIPEKKLPVAQNEDVQYDEKLADEDDIRAQMRAEAANRRAEQDRSVGYDEQKHHRLL